MALPASNIGGFLLGSLLGIFGGAFALAWESGEPGERKPKKARGEGKEKDGGSGSGYSATIPDPVMEVVSLKQVKMDLLHLTGRNMDAPVVHLYPL